MIAAPPTPTVTVSELAALAGVPRHVVLFFLESRGVEPVAKIGPTNVYPASVVAAFRAWRATRPARAQRPTAMSATA